MQFVKAFNDSSPERMESAITGLIIIPCSHIFIDGPRSGLLALYNAGIRKADYRPESSWPAVFVLVLQPYSFEDVT